MNQAGIVVNKASTQLLMSMGLFSDDNRYDASFLSNYADVNLRDALKRVKGVGEVRIFGERKFSMRLWLDPTQLARRKLTAQDVTRALQEQNLQVAAGQVGQPPGREDQPYQIAVRARGRLAEPAEFADIVVQRGADGEVVRLKDVGRVELGAENYASLLRFNGRTGVGLGIFQLPTANALDVRDAVLAEMERLSQGLPAGAAVPARHGHHARGARLHRRGGRRRWPRPSLLVILVIFLFLHGWRSVLITALTLPVSLVGTFAFVKAFGFSINTLTLFGLTLATGLVVDDAIVVIENIERLMHERKLSALRGRARGHERGGGRRHRHLHRAHRRVRAGGLLPGHHRAPSTGSSRSPSPRRWPSPPSARSRSPRRSARCCSRSQHGEKWVFFRKMDQLLDWTRDRYAALLRRLLRHPVAADRRLPPADPGATVLLFRVVPTGFIPEEDQGYLIVSVQGPEGTCARADGQDHGAGGGHPARSSPRCAGMFAVGGFSSPGQRPEHRADLRHAQAVGASARARSTRWRPSSSGCAAPWARIGEARVLPLQPPAIRGVGSVGGFQFVVEDRSGSRSLDELSQGADALIAGGRGRAELRGVFTSFTAATPLLDVEVDRQKAKALGVPMDQIFGTLQIFMGSQYVNDFNYASRTYRVYLQAEQQFRDTPQDIGAFYVR